jgi:hypothetical protein
MLAVQSSLSAVNGDLIGLFPDSREANSSANKAKAYHQRLPLLFAGSNGILPRFKADDNFAPSAGSFSGGMRESRKSWYFRVRFRWSGVARSETVAAISRQR